jgi:hypothetical protein
VLPQNCFVFTKEDVLNLKESYLSGYAITDGALIIGNEGLKEYYNDGGVKLPTDGRFAGIFLLPNGNINIRTDQTGQELIYFFEDGGNWAISNSLLLLADTVKSSTKFTAYLPAIHGFFLKNGIHIGEQQISHRTVFDKIRLLPLTSELTVDNRTREIKEDRRSFLEQFSLGLDVSYEDHFIETMERGAGLLGALQVAGAPLNLFLSGGYDSRLVLCMALANGDLNENFRVSSHEFKADDFRVANSLTERFNIPLNVSVPSHKSTLTSSDSIRAYILNSGCNYLPFYPVSSYYIHEGADIRLTGDQPTGWSHFAGTALFNGNAEKIANDIRTGLKERGTGEAVSKEFLSTFNELQIDKSHPAAMLAHYCAIRSRFHCGRNSYKSLGSSFLFTPLMQRSFVALDLYNAMNGYHPTKFFADAFSAFGDWALTEPFETKAREFSKELIDTSPFKGGVSISPRKYKVYGHFGQQKETSRDIYSLELNISNSQDKIKDELQTMFYRSHRSKKSGIFMDKDFSLANKEIHANQSLSHGYRKLSHIVTTDIALKIIDESGS